jgi:ribonuclease R
VTSFGLFVALDEVYVEGLVHISELGTDYFRYDATRHQLLGERTGMRYRLGDRVRVQLVRVDMETNKIDFVPESVTASDRGQTPKEVKAPKAAKGRGQAPKEVKAPKAAKGRGQAPKTAKAPKVAAKKSASTKPKKKK